MSAPAKTGTLPELPPEVLSFAVEKGVSDFVAPVLEMTARTYPGRSIRLFVEYDYEDPDWQYIVVEVDAGGYSTEQYVAAHHAWAAEFVGTIPAFARQFFVNGAR